MQKGHVPGVGAAVGRAAAVWITWAFEAPRLALALLTALAVGAVIAATGLRVDTDSSHMLSDDLPFQRNAQAVAAAFPATKNTVAVVIRAHHRDAADAATAAIAARLQAQEAEIGRVFAPSFDPFLVSHGLLYNDPGELDRQLSRLAQASNLLAELRANQTTDGFFRALDRGTALAEGAGLEPAALAPFHAEVAEFLRADRIGSPRPLDWQSAFAEVEPVGDVTRLVTIEPKLDFARLNPAAPAIEAVREATESLDPRLDALVEVGVTGDPVLRQEELQSVVSRLPASIALSLFLVAAVLFLTLARPARVFLALGAVLVTIVLTTGFAAIAVGALNLVSIAFVVLTVGLGVDFAIHLLAHVDEETRRGLDGEAAIATAGQEIGAALALSALTTAIAFFAFTMTDFVGMAQLGLIGGGGVLIGLAVALTMVPAALALRPELARGRIHRTELPRVPRWVSRIFTATVVAVGLASVAFLPQARFDADPMKLRNPEAPSVQVYSWLTADPALAPLRLSLIAGTPEEAAATVKKLEALPEVRSAIWLGDLVPKDQEDKLALIDLAWPSLHYAVEGEPLILDPPTSGPLAPRLAALGTPEARRLASELDHWAERRSPEAEAALGELIFRFFPDLMNRIESQLAIGEVTIDALPPELVDRFRSPDGRLRIDIAPSGDVTDPQVRAAFVEAVSSVSARAAGPPAQILGAATAVGVAMIEASTFALLGTLLLAAFMLRSAWQVGAIMLPLLLACSITVAAGVLIGVPFNYANVIVLPLMIGVGVDAGIHLAIRAARGDAAALFDTSTPRAVIASALTTIAAFGTLALSEHRGTASMGLMLCIAMAASIVVIFAITPAIVRLGRR